MHILCYNDTTQLLGFSIRSFYWLYMALGLYINLSLACSIASRIDWPIIGKRISREFDIPKNILDLVYLQAILW